MLLYVRVTSITNLINTQTLKFMSHTEGDYLRFTVREFKIEYLKEKLLNSIIKNLMKSWSSKTVFKSWYKLKTWVWWEPWSHDQVQILATNMDALFYTFLCLF